MQTSRKFGFSALLVILVFMPAISFAAPLTQTQAGSLINIVQASPDTPASAFVSLITAFSSITVAQAESLIGIIQSSPHSPASAFVGFLTAFTQDTTSNTTTKSSISAPTSQTPPNSTLCSGTYYSQCSTGQDFVCPSNGGKAYCQPTPASSASQSQQEAKLQPFKDSFFQNIQNIETKCRSANTGLQVPTCEQAESQLLSILQQEAIIGLSKQDAVPQFDAIQSAYEMLQTEYYSVAQQPIPLGDIQGRQANIAAEMQILANDEAMFNL